MNNIERTSEREGALVCNKHDFSLFLFLAVLSVCTVYRPEKSDKKKE